MKRDGSYALAREAVEGVLLGRAAGATVDMQVLLRAAPGITWRALEGACRRLEAEGRVRCLSGWKQIAHVVVVEPFGP